MATRRALGVIAPCFDEVPYSAIRNSLSEGRRKNEAGGREKL
jgi:hypothetical protein